MSLFIALGGAECVWEDLEAARALIPKGVDVAYGACNIAGIDFNGHLTLWGTLHPEKFKRWQDARARAGRNTDYLAICHKRFHDARIDEVVPELWSGTSGLYVVQAALLHLRYHLVIACGMPIDDRAHYHGKSKWWKTQVYQKGWQRKARSEPRFCEGVRSMSGWTRELCGPPTEEWLATLAD